MDHTEKIEDVLQKGQAEAAQTEEVQAVKEQAEVTQEEEVQTAEAKKKEKLAEEEAAVKEDPHLVLIRSQVEAASVPEAYETYIHAESEAEKGLMLFAARRKGTSHKDKKMPCQDYCLTAAVNGLTVLACADGVSSCSRSDIGARLACEALVKTVATASESCRDENQLVRRIHSVSFREKLVSAWIRMVMEEIDKAMPEGTFNRIEEFTRYGSTLMYAVFTENHILTGNLGDGQILIFNDDFGVKLRVHGPKESPRVRCLVNERCAREDFVTGIYPRNCFTGVLLSTDGMYESLDKSSHFFEYALQMKERFTGRENPEPYQPFCYQEKGEPYKDFSVMRTGDDCSIVLALDEKKKPTDFRALQESIRSHTDASLFDRWDPACMSFYVRHEETYAEVLISREETFEIITEFRNAVPDLPADTWTEGGYRFCLYPDEGRPSLEFLHAGGAFRRSRTGAEEADRLVEKILRSAAALEKELGEKGLRLNTSSSFNLLFDGDKLHIRAEALEKADKAAGENSFSLRDRYFSHVPGFLECRDASHPLYDIGYLDRGSRCPRMKEKAGGKEEDLLQLVRRGRKLMIQNISAFAWKLEDGSLLEKGEVMDLEDGRTFTLMDKEGKELETYMYRSKEGL